MARGALRRAGRPCFQCARMRKVGGDPPNPPHRALPTRPDRHSAALAGATDTRADALLVFFSRYPGFTLVFIL